MSRKGLQTPRATEERPAAGRSDTDLILAKIAELQAQRANIPHILLIILTYHYNYAGEHTHM